MRVISDIFWSIPLGGKWGILFEWLPMVVCVMLFLVSVGAFVGASKGAMLAGEPPPGCPFGYLALAGMWIYGYGFIKALL